MQASRTVAGVGGKMGRPKRFNKNRIARVLSFAMSAVCVDLTMETGVFGWQMVGSPEATASMGAAIGSYEYWSACSKKSAGVADPTKAMSLAERERYSFAKMECVVGFDPALLDRAKVGASIEAAPGDAVGSAMAAVTGRSRHDELLAAGMDDPLGRAQMGAVLRMTALYGHQLAAIEAGKPELAEADKARANGVLAQGLAALAAEKSRSLRAESIMPVATTLIRLGQGRGDVISAMSDAKREILLAAYWRTQHADQGAEAHKRLSDTGKSDGMAKVQADAAAWAKTQP